MTMKFLMSKCRLYYMLLHYILHILYKNCDFLYVYVSRYSTAIGSFIVTGFSSKITSCRKLFYVVRKCICLKNRECINKSAPKVSSQLLFKKKDATHLCFASISRKRYL